MSDVRLFSLDERGLAYVRDHLSGVNAFCTALLRLVDAVEGETFTVAPADTATEKLYQFSSGGLLRENLDFSRAFALPGVAGTFMSVQSLRDKQSRRILASLREHPGSICIIDDYNPRWGDALLAESQSAFGVGEEGYHLLTSSDDEEIFETVLARSDTLWHGVAAVCARKVSFGIDRVTTVAELQASAETVVELTCTAYDGEGFVGWQRSIR